MCFINRLWLCVIALTLFVSGADAALIDSFETAGSDLNLAIPDDGYAGDVTVSSEAATASVAVQFVEPNPQIVKVHVVTTGITHSRVGDLVIKLMSPEGTMVTLMNRPGVGSSADDGTAAGGAAGMFDSAARIDFADDNATSAEMIGDGLIFLQTVGVHSGDAYRPDNDGAAGEGLLAAFNGENPNGLWKLFVGDGEVFETGALDYWGLTIEIVPEPAALGLLIPGMMFISRRRVRH